MRCVTLMTWQSRTDLRHHGDAEQELRHTGDAGDGCLVLEHVRELVDHARHHRLEHAELSANQSKHSLSYDHLNAR